MDDIPDKVRRNLVVFSAAAIGTSIFEVKPSTSVLGLTVSNNHHPSLPWIAVALILVYLVLRFQFAPKLIETRTAWHQQHAEDSGAWLYKYIKSEMREVARGHRGPIGFKIESSTRRFEGRYLVEINSESETTPFLMWQGEDTTVFRARWASSVGNTTTGETIWDNDFSSDSLLVIGQSLRKSADRREYWARYLPSWESFEHQFPRVIAAVAAVAIAFRFGYSLA